MVSGCCRCRGEAWQPQGGSGVALRRHDSCPRCSGSGSVLSFPTLLPGALPAVTCTGGQGGLRGRGLSLSRCAVVPHGAPWGAGARMRALVWQHRVALPLARPCSAVPSARSRGGRARGDHCLLEHEPSLPCRWWDGPEPAPGMAAVEGVQPGWGLQPPCLCLANSRVLSCSPGHCAWSGERRLDQY